MHFLVSIRPHLSRSKISQSARFSHICAVASDGLHPSSDGLQPRSDGLHPSSDISIRFTSHKFSISSRLSYPLKLRTGYEQHSIKKSGRLKLLSFMIRCDYSCAPTCFLRLRCWKRVGKSHPTSGCKPSKPRSAQ